MEDKPGTSEAAWPSRKLANFALAVLLLAYVFSFIDRIILSMLVGPIKADLHLTDTQIALVNGLAFSMFYATMGLPLGWLVDRTSRKGVVAAGIALWSLVTAFSGLAKDFGHLFLARMGVGVGEAIGLPGNQSVIADYFPPHKRGFAMSVLLLAPPVGAFIGFVGGGWIAQNFDWRWTFAIAAVPGLILGVLVHLFIAEPPRGQHDADASDDVPTLGDVIRRFIRLPSARHLVIGSTLAATLGFGLNYFFTSLMIRRFDLGIGEAGLYAGLIASLPAAISVLASGWLADRWGAKRPSAYAIIPGICMLIGGPLYALAITRDDLGLLLALVTVSALLQFGYLGITFATLQNMMHPRMRATASALLNAIYAIAGGLGPVILGAMSDSMDPGYGPGEGLAIAMALMSGIYLWAGAHYLLAARHIGRDMAAAREGRV